MPQTVTRFTSGICLLLLAHSALGQEKTSNPTGNQFFETNVRPVLASRCFRCHGPEMQKGRLRVDSLAALLQGGRSGPALQPGQPDGSLLIQAIRHGENLQMPPRLKLPPREIAALTAWVKMGAPWPNAKPVVTSSSVANEPVFTHQQTSHWAFQPIRKPPIPAVKNQAWVRSPLDAFILARLEAQGLTPAPPAEPRTLLRRLHFDLLGLPPTPEEVEDFVRACAGSPEHRQAALEKVVDRLLASPRYGERWARHWLDVARYADSNGMDENLVFGNAWRYRDYVIQALNADKPYDQFVREQVAGDLLPGSTSAAAERLIATGFLCIGPKMLAEDDPAKMEMDIIDEQLDTLGRAFLGLTLGCARCHDHKFDPITSADYYSLAGILKSTRTMDNFRVVARWQERQIGPEDDLKKARLHAQQVAKLKESTAELLQRHAQEVLAPARQRAREYLQTARAIQQQGPLELRSLLAQPQEARPAGVILIEAEDYARGNTLKSFNGYGEKIGVIYNKGILPNLAEYDVQVKEAGNYQLELRYAAAEKRPVQVLVNGQLLPTAAGRVTGTWYPDTQTWFAEGVVSLPAGKHVLRLERAGPFPHLDKLALVPTTQTAPKSLEQWAREANLLPELLRQWMEYLQKNPAPKETELPRISLDPKGPFRFSSALEAAFSPQAQAELRTQREQLARLEKAVPVLPEAMAVSDGPATNLRIHLRGNHLTLGKEVPRQFPRIFSQVQANPIAATQSGRLQLAEWLTRPEHPLTSRVLVNRVWHWHFGAGLVRSVDNFGLLGERPSHPELLDWLAERFSAPTSGEGGVPGLGWSLKALHRLLVLSSTYQQGTTYNPAAYQSDPDNRLHWRHNRRRLEVEALRDALLQLSGTLDLRLGGSLFEGQNRKYVPGYPNSNYEKYDFPRRSVYLPVVRSALYDVFQAFDFADPSYPSGERAVTTVAPQALFLLNGQIVHEQTRLWTTRLLAEKKLDDAGRVRRLYYQALGRPPSVQETTQALAFVQRIAGELGRQQSADARTQAWHSLGRVIVSANEFVYVE